MNFNSQKINLFCETIYVNSKRDIFATDGYISYRKSKETLIYSNEMNLNSKKVIYF